MMPALMFSSVACALKIFGGLYFVLIHIITFRTELEQYRRQRRRGRHKSACLMSKNDNFCTLGLAFFIVTHSFDVLCDVNEQIVQSCRRINFPLLFTFLIGHFRVPISLSFKASLSAKFLLWQLAPISI